MKWAFWRKPPIMLPGKEWERWLIRTLENPYFAPAFVQHVKKLFADEGYRRNYQASVKRAGYDVWIGKGCNPNPFWTMTTGVFRARANFSCERCGARGALHIHHKDYERTLGIEVLFPDLITALCPWDHEAISGKSIVSGALREMRLVEHALTGQVVELATKHAELERKLQQITRK